MQRAIVLFRLGRREDAERAHSGILSIAPDLTLVNLDSMVATWDDRAMTPLARMVVATTSSE